MRIQNNITAMNTHRQYTINNDNVAKSAEKLSSGYRINRAGDDAAGLAISEKMRSQIRGLNMATKNSQDAISLVQTAEGALQETQNMLQRMNELAVQAATGTNETLDRNALAKEFEQLKKEINDIAEQTTFNNMKILDGSLSYTGYVRSAATAGVTSTVENMSNVASKNPIGEITSVDGTDAKFKSDAIPEKAVFASTKDMAKSIKDLEADAEDPTQGTKFYVNLEGLKDKDGNDLGKVSFAVDTHEEADKTKSLGEVIASKIGSELQTKLGSAQFTAEYEGDGITIQDSGTAGTASLKDVTLSISKTDNPTPSQMADGIARYEAADAESYTGTVEDAVNTALSKDTTNGESYKLTLSAGDKTIEITGSGEATAKPIGELLKDSTDITIKDGDETVTDVTFSAEYNDEKGFTFKTVDADGNATDFFGTTDIQVALTNPGPDGTPVTGSTNVTNTTGGTGGAVNATASGLNYATPLAATDLGKTYTVSFADGNHNAEVSVTVTQADIEGNKSIGQLFDGETAPVTGEGEGDEPIGTITLGWDPTAGSEKLTFTTKNNAEPPVAADLFANDVKITPGTMGAASASGVGTVTHITEGVEGTYTVESDLDAATGSALGTSANAVKAQDGKTYTMTFTGQNAAGEDTTVTLTVVGNAQNANNSLGQLFATEATATATVDGEETDVTANFTWKTSSDGSVAGYSLTTDTQLFADGSYVGAELSTGNGDGDPGNVTCTDYAERTPADPNGTDATAAKMTIEVAFPGKAPEPLGPEASEEDKVVYAAKKEAYDKAVAEGIKNGAQVTIGEKTYTYNTNVDEDGNPDINKATDFHDMDSLLALINADNDKGTEGGFKATNDGNVITLTANATQTANAGDPITADNHSVFDNASLPGKAEIKGSNTSEADGKKTTVEFDFAKMQEGDKVKISIGNKEIFVPKEKGDTRKSFMEKVQSELDSKIKDERVHVGGNALISEGVSVKVEMELVENGLKDKETNAIRIQVGALENEQLSVSIDSMNTKGLGLDDAFLMSQSNPTGAATIDQDAAGDAITKVRNAINKVSDQRATLGAMQNRLDHKIANLKVASENLSASESRIRDVDMAQEMTNFTKNNILSQAATAMLAQANSLPQNVLSLLG